MKFLYVVFSLIFFSIGFFFPIYKVAGIETFQFKTDAGEWNYFYLMYAFYLVICLIVNIIVAKIRTTEIWFLFVNTFVMVIYMLYMIWESEKEAFLVAVTFSYILVLVLQIGLLIIRNLIRLTKEEKTMENNEKK